MELLNINEQEIKLLLEKLDLLRKKGMNQQTILEILNDLMPANAKDNIDIKIDKGLCPISFSPDDTAIYLTIEKLHKTIKKSIQYIRETFPNIDDKDMYNYYVIYALNHELRHIGQYMIVNEHIESPYEIVKKVYKTIFNVGHLSNNPFKNIITENINDINNERLVIERNATIEASEIVKKLEEREENKEIANVFEELKHKNMIYGYDDIYNGSVEETYKRLYLNQLYKELPKEEAIPIRDRILYGLPINEETKNKVLENKY